MGIDKGIDPYTGEYLPSRINHLGNAVYIRLATPLGSWWADTSIGSRLHELARSKDLPRIGKLARQYAAAALQPLIDDGRRAPSTWLPNNPTTAVACSLSPLWTPWAAWPPSSIRCRWPSHVYDPDF